MNIEKLLADYAEPRKIRVLNLPKEVVDGAGPVKLGGRLIWLVLGMMLVSFCSIPR